MDDTDANPNDKAIPIPTDDADCNRHPDLGPVEHTNMDANPNAISNTFLVDDADADSNASGADSAVYTEPMSARHLRCIWIGDKLVNC